VTTLQVCEKKTACSSREIAMSWTRPYEVFFEMCIAMWLVDNISRAVRRHRILH
jgi:hypothetical protein